MKKIRVPSIRSPLRYPGGKSRALKQILPIVPPFEEFREPFVGGGSVFFACKQLYPNSTFWINDINQNLYLFWRHCKNDIDHLVSEIKRIKEQFSNGKELHTFLLQNHLTEFDKAVRFFILNRITFSGLVDSGGYSEGSFKGRFTDSSIERVKKASQILQGTTITNQDYEQIINADGENVFIFLDPPYLSTSKSKLYGRSGDLHQTFDHKRFSEKMGDCNHRWLITYDDSPEIRKLFDFANKYRWTLQYSMNNYKQDKASKGKELFISNYEIESLEDKKVI